MNDAPSEREPLFRVWSKGTTQAGAQVKRGIHWMAARRGWLSVFEDRLEMGRWSILYADIHTATLLQIGGLVGGYVLQLDTAKGGFQFGINPWALKGKRFPFPHEEKPATVAYSPFSIAVRVIIIVWLILWFVGKL